VLRVECPREGRVLSGFKAQVSGVRGIVTALHGVVGCSDLLAFNNDESYPGLRILNVDIGLDAAFLTSAALEVGSDWLETAGFQGQDLRVVGYPQGLGYQFSHRVEPQLTPLRPLRTSLPDDVANDLERRGSPELDQTILSLSGAIQNGYSGAPILTWEGQVIAVANGGLKSGSVDIGWAMPLWEASWEEAGGLRDELASLADGSSTALFGAQASSSTNLPTFYLTDGGSQVGRIYEVSEGRLREIYVRQRGRLYYVAVDRQGTIYFSNGNDREIYRLEGGRESRVYTHSTYTRDLAFDAEGHLYFSESTGAGGDGTIYRLHGAQAMPFYRVRLGDVDGFWAGSFAFDSEGTLWLSSGNRRPAALYKVVEGRPRRMVSSGGSIAGFAFSDSGDLLYADWRQRVHRLELPGFLASEALVAGRLEWASDVAVAPSR